MPISGTPSPVPAADTVLDPQERALTSALVLFGLLELIFDAEVVPSSTSSEIEKQAQPSQVPASTIELAMQACQSLVDIYEYLHPRFAGLKEEAQAESTELSDSSAIRVPEEVTGQAGFEPREFFLGIIGIMAVLMGGLALQGVEQIRWRFIENPTAATQPANAGGFASCARSMLSHYKKVRNRWFFAFLRVHLCDCQRGNSPPAFSAISALLLCSV